MSKRFYATYKYPPISISRLSLIIITMSLIPLESGASLIIWFHLWHRLGIWAARRIQLCKPFFRKSVSNELSTPSHRADAFLRIMTSVKICNVDNENYQIPQYFYYVRFEELSDSSAGPLCFNAWLVYFAYICVFFLFFFRFLFSRVFVQLCWFV